MVNRRKFLGISIGAGATLALTPELLRALRQSSGQLIQRAIPSSGEMLPVIGLQFGNPPPPDHAALKEVLRTLVENGGTFLDTVHGNSQAEEITARLATELGIQDKLFWSSRGSPPGPSQPGVAVAKAQIERSLARFKVPAIDLVLWNPFADPTHLEGMKEEKQAGRVRYIGVQVINDHQYPQVESLMRNEPIDFIGVDYSIDNRGVEETLLPLARERKIGVVAYLPFGQGSLFQRAGTTPLPEWAADFDATTWAQFFLKYLVSHPAITVVRVGTSKPHHMLDNIGGGSGRLPDEATRKRMAALVDALPALPPTPQNPAAAPGIALPVAVLDRYVGEYKAASGFTATFRRHQDRLLMKPGTGQEAPLNARSETRFQDPRGPFFEFQLDAQGKVTGAILEQGTQRTSLTRVR